MGVKNHDKPITGVRIGPFAENHCSAAGSEDDIEEFIDLIAMCEEGYCTTLKSSWTSPPQGSPRSMTPKASLVSVAMCYLR
eukprot:2959362-Amphidinium_carterae.1